LAQAHLRAQALLLTGAKRWLHYKKLHRLVMQRSKS
jgi:hypothetical protein